MTNFILGGAHGSDCVALYSNAKPRVVVALRTDDTNKACGSDKETQSSQRFPDHTMPKKHEKKNKTTAAKHMQKVGNKS